MSDQVLIAPSLLAADFSNLESEVQRCHDGGADFLHLDYMDGNFVANLSFGFCVTEAVRKKFPEALLDVHLMVEGPGDYLARLAEMDVQMVSVHWEACTHLHATLQQIKKLGMRAGVAFNPHTPIEGLKHVMDLVDNILIMTVNPGFGGQKFLSHQLPKIEQARALADQEPRDVWVSVDGGVNEETAAQCRSAGANYLVAGSYLFGHPNFATAVKSLR